VRHGPAFQSARLRALQTKRRQRHGAPRCS
jgi:hypothetical protein